METFKNPIYQSFTTAAKCRANFIFRNFPPRESNNSRFKDDSISIIWQNREEIVLRIVFSQIIRTFGYFFFKDNITLFVQNHADQQTRGYEEQ